MLPYFILGLALLVGARLAIRWFVKAEPAQVVKALRWSLVVVAVVGGVFLIFAGRHVLHPSLVVSSLQRSDVAGRAPVIGTW